jgi:HEPN domain-containing protein
MEQQQLNYKEWFFQSDYDLETAQQMLLSGRNIYCIFMCHLSLEKTLKGLFIKRTNKIPPKIHNLNYFVNKINLIWSNDYQVFLKKMDSLSIVTRYPEDLQAIITLYYLQESYHNHP